MSDDQMRGLKDLLRTESSGPVDVTAPTNRPTGLRGLNALAAVALTATRVELPPEPSVAGPADPTQPSVTTPAPKTSAIATPRAPATPLATRRKTSVTLPPVVRDRVADAYHRSRWTLMALLELVGERLNEGQIRRSDVEAAVMSLSDGGGGSASIRSLSVPASLLDQLDQLSSAWRLSRSALIAACLVLVLDHLPD